MKKQEDYIDGKTIAAYILMGSLLAAIMLSQTGCETVDVGVGLYAPAPVVVAPAPVYVAPPPPPQPIYVAPPRPVIVVPAHRPPMHQYRYRGR